MKKKSNGKQYSEEGSKDDIEISVPLRMELKSFDDMLPLVGDFGLYQWLLLLALIPYCFIYSILYFGQFFITLTPVEHWCHVEGLGNLTREERISRAIPPSPNYPYYDTCHRWNDTSSGRLKNDTVVRCTSWEYNFTTIPYSSLATELDWVCDNSYLVSTAQSIYFSGSIVGGLLFGWLADHRGRIPALVICNGIGLLATITTTYTDSFWSFSLVRFFTGLAFDNCINIPLIIVMEYVAVEKRSLVVNGAFGLYFAFSSTILPWVAYVIADWRIFCYVTAIPLLSSIITPWILPESARWYLANGMPDKVIEKLKRIAKFNKKTVDPIVYDTFAENLKKGTDQNKSATLLDLFRTPRLAKHSVLVILLWFLTALAFDGYVYSLKRLPGSVFVSFAFASATELPAGILLILTLDRWGRRFCAFIPAVLVVLCSLLLLFITTEIESLIIAVTARFLLNMLANIVLQLAAEVLPTPVRAQGISLVHIFGIMAHSLAPYVIELARIWDGLPMLTLALVSAGAAVLILFVPETMGEDLPQTLKEGEDFGKNQKFWSVPNCCGNKLTSQ